MNRRLLVLLAVMLFGCAHPLKTVTSTDEEHRSDQKGEIIPLAGTFKVHRFSFNNGLNLLVVVDPSSPTFAYQTWFRVGSRDEVPGKTGLAHLFEHMMFKGTKNMKEGEFDRILESAGAQGENAFTSRDYTAYIQELPQDKLELIAKAEADRMMNLVVNEASFKTEREVVQNERRFRNENSPDGLMDQELFVLAFKKSPYRWPVIGYQKDLAEMTAEDAVKFYKSFYNPNHATIIVTGAVDPEQVRATVQKYYGNLASQPPADRPNLDEEPQQTAPRRKTLKLNVRVEKLLLGYHIPDLKSPDTPALNVLQNILAGGKSSRLSRALVETGIATSVEASALENRDPSLFMISVNLQKGKRASQAESIILKELARVRRELVPDLEMKRAKNRFDFSFFENLNSNYTRAYFLGHYEISGGDFQEGIRLQSAIQKVTPEDVRRVAQSFLDPKNRTVITGVPK